LPGFLVYWRGAWEVAVTMLERARRVLRLEAPRLRRLGIGKAGIFGSVARGEDGPESDVDILIELAPDHQLTLVSMIELEADLSSRLEKKVELVVGPSMKPRIKDRAYRELVQLFP